MRGDIISIASKDAEFTAKPRPALIIQTDLYSDHPTVTVLPITSTIAENASIIRVDVFPDETNGLQKYSQIQIDKISTLKRVNVGKTFGRLDRKTMIEVERLIAVFIGLG